MKDKRVVHLQLIGEILTAGCHIKLSGPYCGTWTIEKDEVTCKNCLRMIAAGKYNSMFSAIEERKEYLANAESSCIYISDVVPVEMVRSSFIYEPVPSCITELPKHPGEKIKWQKSKTLLWICLHYIKRMLLITRLFYDNSQKNSE